MMEKRNFVTSGRTVDGASEVDDIVDVGLKAFGAAKQASDKSFEKKASAEDEKSDKSDGNM